MKTILGFFILALLPLFVAAQTPHVADGIVIVNPTPLPTPAKLTTTFGSKSKTGLSGCKVEAQAEKLVISLKSDCEAWRKDRQSELKNKFLVGTCEESCDDCSMGMKRCTVVGTVEYNPHGDVK